MRDKILILTRKHPILTAFGLYVVVAVLFSLPLVFKLGSEIPKGGGDVYQVISSIDSEIVQVRNLSFLKGAILLVKNLNTFTPYVLLGLVVGKVLAYNLLFLFSYVLSGLGAFLLARYYVKNDGAAFVAGLLFALAPFHYYQTVAVHLGTMQQQWLPFLILFLAKFFEKFQFKYFLAVGCFAFLVAMSEHQMLAFALLFMLVFAVSQIWVRREILRNWKFWFYILAALGMLAVVIFGMFSGMLKVATSDNNFLAPGMNATNKYAMKMLDPVMPSIFQPIWGGLSEKLQNLVLGGANRGSYFLGFSTIGLLFFFARAWWKKDIEQMQEKTYQRSVQFWSGVALLFYVFALGVSFSIGKFNLYLPYYLVFKFLPFYENIRTTGRIFVFAILAVAVLSAYGLDFWLRKYPAKKNFLLAGFACLLLLEFWVAPLATMPIAYSPFYDQLAKDSEQYKLIEVPGSTNYEFASYDLFLNTIAKKPVLNGMPLARKISGQFDLQQATPVIKQLLYTMPKGNDPEQKDNMDIITSFDYTKANEVLSYHKVRYVTLSKLYAKAEVLNLEQTFIEKNLAYVQRYEDQYLIAYEIKQVSPVSFYADLTGEQFSKSFLLEGRLARVMGDGGALSIVNMAPIVQKVKISLSAKNSNQPLQLALKNNPAVFSKNLTDTLTPYVFETTLIAGENTIEFAVTDQAGKPVTMKNSNQTRQGVIVMNIQVMVE
ncbi:MAG: hypothetical protein WCJ51_02500 [Candidatus Moraniibacteriota bacterium]